MAEETGTTEVKTNSLSNAFFKEETGGINNAGTTTADDKKGAGETGAGATVTEEQKQKNIAAGLNEDGTTKENKEGSLNSTEVKPKTFEELYKEKFERDYDEKQEQLIKEGVIPQAEPEIVAQLKKYMTETGYSADDFLTTQTLDPEDFTEAELIAFNMQLDSAKSDDEIALEMEIKYKFDQWKDKPEDYDDGVEPKEITLAKKQFEREAAEAKQKIVAYKNKWAVNPDKGKQEEAKKAAQLKLQKDNEAGEKQLADEINKLDKLVFKVSDKESLEFILKTPEEKVATQKLVSDVLFRDHNAFWNNYRDEKGAFKMKELSEDMHLLKNKASVLKGILEQGVAQGRALAVAEYKNAGFTPNSTAGTGTTGKSWQQQAAEKM